MGREGHLKGNVSQEIYLTLLWFIRILRPQIFTFSWCNNETHTCKPTYNTNRDSNQGKPFKLDSFFNPVLLVSCVICIDSE